MILVRVDVLHPAVVGQLDALVNDLLRQMGDGEEVHVLIVVRRPQLRLFGQDVLGAVDVEEGSSHQRLLCLHRFYVVVGGVGTQQTG